MQHLSVKSTEKPRRLKQFWRDSALTRFVTGQPNAVDAASCRIVCAELSQLVIQAVFRSDLQALKA